MKATYLPLALLWDMIWQCWSLLIRFIGERIERARERAHGEGAVIVIRQDEPRSDERKAS
jgi:hypothetical protein